MVYAGHSSQVLEQKLRFAGWVFGAALNLQVFSVRGLGFRGATRPKPKDSRPIGRFVQTSQKIIWNHGTLGASSVWGPRIPNPKSEKGTQDKVGAFWMSWEWF